jgi:hypothetical protein
MRPYLEKILHKKGLVECLRAVGPEFKPQYCKKKKKKKSRSVGQRDRLLLVKAEGLRVSQLETVDYLEIAGAPTPATNSYSMCRGEGLAPTPSTPLHHRALQNSYQ